MHPLQVCFIMLILQRSDRLEFLKNLAVAVQSNTDLNTWSGLYRHVVDLEKKLNSKSMKGLQSKSYEYSSMVSR
jgi:hypothetical protein